MRYFLSALILLLPLSADARPGSKEPVTIYFTAADGTSFATEDMTGPAQTSVFEVAGLDYVELYLSALSVTGTANVSVDCYVGPTSATATYHIQSESLSSGVATQYDYIPTKSVTTAKKWHAIIPIKRASYMYCTVTCASGTIDLVLRGGNY